MRTQKKTRPLEALNHPVYVRLPNWIGDACMCLPALHLLQSAGLSLVLCGRPWAKDLLSELKPHGFINVELRLKDRILSIKNHKKIPRPLGIIFPNSFSSAASFRLAGIRSAGYYGDGRRLLLQWGFKKANTHEVDVFYQLARQALMAWGRLDDNTSSAVPLRLNLPLSQGHFTMAQQACDQMGIDPPYVLLAPTVVGRHQGQNKAWPYFDQLAKALTDAGYTCVMCPPPNEIEQATRSVPHAKLLPSLSLGGFAALAKNAALVICNDSGSSHVAAAVDAQLITIFGVTSLSKTGPWSPNALCLGTKGAWPEPSDVIESALTKLQSNPR